MAQRRLLLSSFLLLLGAIAPLAAADQSIGAQVNELASMWATGGKTMWLIGAVSLFCLAIAIERVVRLRRSRIAPRGFADRVATLWDAQKHDEIIALCKSDDSILARVVKTMVENRDLPTAELRQVASDLGGNEMRFHQRRAQALAVGATMGPLLGLLGAVNGLMAAFKDFGLLGEAGDPSVFAGHISLALVPTAAGILMSLPCYAGYFLFRSRAGMLGEELESQLQTVMLRCFLRRPGK